MPRSRISRRRFLALALAGTTVAAGGAVAATDKQGKAKRARPAKPPVYATPPAPSAEIEHGIRQQKESTHGALETLRAFELPTGSEQAFAFRPMPANRVKK